MKLYKIKIRFQQGYPGFTIIELLVVIAVIALLSSVVLVSVTNARSKAYDSARLQDLSTLRTALEAYSIDHGSYPVVPFGTPAVSTWNPEWTTAIGPLTPKYLSKTPTPTGLVAQVVTGYPGISRMGDYVYIPIDNQSGNYNQYNLTVLVPGVGSHTVCLYPNSYILGTWLNNTDTNFKTWLVSFSINASPTILVNSAMFGGNFDDPYTGPSCNTTQNP